jgi:hypothetical protein
MDTIDDDVLHRLVDTAIEDLDMPADSATEPLDLVTMAAMASSSTTTS